MEIENYFRCYAEIDLDNIRRNLISLKEKANPKEGVIGVIKADGYGHGAVPIALATDDLCSGYAVATAYEGHNLRRHKVTKPLFLLGYTPESTYDMVLCDDMIPAIFSLEMARTLSEHAVHQKKKAKINIAVDTGMSRIGYFPCRQSVEEILQISRLPNLEIFSAFTHFAKADYRDKSFAKKQLRDFEKFIKDLEAEGVKIPFPQCANSAAMMELPEASMQFARAGISMYGLYPSEEMDRNNMKLYPAMSLFSHVVHVKEIEPGRGVSYGQTFVASKPMKIATIPVGYGDGYPRNLSNKGYVIIHGKKAMIVGRICMDQFMVDVTDMEVSVGDLVTLVGTEGKESITVDELAALAGTFPYEFVCNLGKRIPRVFIKNQKIIGTKDYYDDDYSVNL